ncbi:DoxX family protein [Sphingobacterium suaedae]|uniref:DoxX family protein n=1 Tax=Sphingobacterium suaedae TaxID=1686402 RepID=A0ABW5KH47_9SPHI
MKKLKMALHWIAYIYYVYIFGYASLFKLFQKESMMVSMSSLGFDRMWTLWIGVGECIGVIFLLLGFVWPRWKNLGVLVLAPFAIGAFTAHMAHSEYVHYYNSLAVCLLSVFLLATDKRFHLSL